MFENYHLLKGKYDGDSHTASTVIKRCCPNLHGILCWLERNLMPKHEVIEISHHTGNNFHVTVLDKRGLELRGVEHPARYRCGLTFNVVADRVEFNRKNDNPRGGPKTIGYGFVRAEKWRRIFKRSIEFRSRLANGDLDDWPERKGDTMLDLVKKANQKKYHAYQS